MALRTPPPSRHVRCQWSLTKDLSCTLDSTPAAFSKQKVMVTARRSDGEGCGGSECVRDDDWPARRACRQGPKLAVGRQMELPAHGLSGFGIEASRSAQRTLDAPVARYPVGRDRRSPRFGGGRPVVPARRFSDRHSRPPIPASRRGRGSGGWPGAGPWAGPRLALPARRKPAHAAVGTAWPMVRNNSSRARFARRFASRSDTA